MTEFKDILGYEGLYQINNIGTVISVRNDREIKPFKTIQGYIRIELNNNGIAKKHNVHRLLATAFIENPLKKPYINHKNSIRDDNRIDNLEWCTHKENMQHAASLNRFPGGTKNLFGNGESHPLSKLNPEKVLEIRRLSSLKMPQRKIAKEFGVSQKNILCIIKRKTWTHI